MKPKPIPREDAGQIVIPLHVEEISFAKKRVVTGRVRISTVTRQQEQLVDELLTREQVEIERTPMSKTLDRMPAVREECDVIIIPVVEETLVIERRLILKEEIRIRRVRSTERHQERLNVRKQEVVVARIPV